MTTPARGQMAAQQNNPNVRPEENPQEQPFTACFSVVAETDPATLSRVLEPFSKRGLTPSHVYAMRTGSHGESMSIDLQLIGADRETQWRLANDLRGQWLVETVLTSQKATV